MGFRYVAHRLARRVRPLRIPVSAIYIGHHLPKRLDGHGLVPRLIVLRTDRLHHAWDAVFRRDAIHYVLELSTRLSTELDDTVIGHGADYLYWLTQCAPDVEHLSATISDGDRSGFARYAPSSSRVSQVLIPDPYFFRESGFRWARELAETADVPWHSRSCDIVWRGSCTGAGSFDPGIGREAPRRAGQRLLMCLAAQDVPEVDAAFVSYSHQDIGPLVLPACGLIRPSVAEPTWIGRKFAIDVDGHSNTWSNLIIRLHLGCCVIPWEHYVPVRADLSDFAEKVEWVRANDGRAAEIAANGRALARSLTFESVRDEATALITANWKSDDPYTLRELPPQAA